MPPSPGLASLSRSALGRLLWICNDSACLSAITGYKMASIFRIKSILKRDRDEVQKTNRYFQNDRHINLKYKARGKNKQVFRNRVTESKICFSFLPTSKLLFHTKFQKKDNGGNNILRIFENMYTCGVTIFQFWRKVGLNP